MPDKKHNIPKQLSLGKRGSSSEAQLPKGVGSGGKINTNFQDIKWTPRKLTVTVALLCIPYLFATVISFLAGNYLIGFVFIGIGAFVVGIYLLLRYLERSDL